MYVIGIDLSKNYPAMCVSEDFEHFEFIGYINDWKMSNVNLNYVITETSKYENVTINHIAENSSTDSIYHVNERTKLKSFHRVVSNIVKDIRVMITHNPVIVAMEGISYGSKGSALVDICMLTGALRRALLVDVLNNDANRLFVFAPSELKNAIGLKGNATKTEVLAQFIDDPGIDAVRDTGMHRFMREHLPGDSPGEDSPACQYVYNSKKDEVCSPFNDMIDAYLSVLKIKQNLS
jgi:Holliday junction resolvasome RuvABC endonuclease subunit